MLKVCASPIFESAMYVSGASPVEVSRAQFALLSPVVSARAVTLFYLVSPTVVSVRSTRAGLRLHSAKWRPLGPAFAVWS